MKTKLVAAVMTATLMVASPICALANGSETDGITQGTVKDRIAHYEAIAVIESLTDAEKQALAERIQMFGAFMEYMFSRAMSDQDMSDEE